MTTEEIIADVKNKIELVILGHDVVGVSRTFGDKSAFPSWTGTFLEPFRKLYTSERGAAIGLGYLLTEVCMKRQKGIWYGVKRPGPRINKANEFVRL